VGRGGHGSDLRLGRLIMPPYGKKVGTMTKALSNRWRSGGMRTWCLTSRLERAG